MQGGRFARPSTRSAYTYTPSGSSPAQLASPCFGPFRSALRNCGFVPKPCFCGLSARPSASPLKTLRVFRRLPDPNRGRAWHPREFGAVLGGSASLPLPAPPLPSSSRRYAPQCFVGGYASSPCDVSHRASDEPRRCMSLSSALAPSSLASPPIRRVFLRTPCARRRPVGSLNPVRGGVCPPGPLSYPRASSHAERRTATFHSCFSCSTC